METSIAFPDITLVPRLAQIFGTTIGELFDYRSSEIKADVMSYAERSWKTRNDNPQTAREALEEGLIKYPDNDILLNNLLYVIDDPDEIIKIACRLLDITHSDDIKYDTLRILASAYSDKGDTESTAAALEKIPEIYFSKLEYMAYLLKGDAKREAADKQKWLSFESLIKMMWVLADCFEENDDHLASLAELKRICSLFDALAGEDEVQNFRRVYIDELNDRIMRLTNN